MAQRSAQTAALALLREVVRRSSASNRRPPGAPVEEVPSSVQAAPSSVQQVPSSTERNVARVDSAPAASSGNSGSAAAVAAAAASGGGSSPPKATAAPAAKVGDNGGTADVAAAAVGGWVALRRALLQRTPLLAGLVRCLIGASAAAAAAAAASVRYHPGGVDGDQEAGQGATVRVVHEACATLRCLLSSEVGGCLLPGGDGARSEIPQAVFQALEGVLGRGSSEQAAGVSTRWGGGGGGCDEAVRIRLYRYCQESMMRTEWMFSLCLIMFHTSYLMVPFIDTDSVKSSIGTGEDGGERTTVMSL